MKILIVEDENSIAQRLQRMIADILKHKIPDIVIVYTFVEALSFIKKNKIDLLLLDLNLNGSDGFEILQIAVGYPFHTIIISAYHEKAILAFDHGVLDFIPKPFTHERLNKGIDRFMERTPIMHTVKYLSIKRHKRMEVVNTADVKYIKAAGDYSLLYFNEGASSLHDKSLENLEAMLAPEFERIHKSYLVRKSLIKTIHTSPGARYSMELSSGDILPIGRTRIKAVRLALLK